MSDRRTFIPAKRSMNLSTSITLTLANPFRLSLPIQLQRQFFMYLETSLFVSHGKGPFVLHPECMFNNKSFHIRINNYQLDNALCQCCLYNLYTIVVIIFYFIPLKIGTHYFTDEQTDR